ncbi:MAG: CHASE2 domain-containing protein [Microcoleaceae cyanobacterium]
MQFKLKVLQIQALCDFDLSWGNGCNLNIPLEYPTLLTHLYHQWQQAYLNYYKGLRGKITEGAGTAQPKDWRGILVEAEAKLLDRFHNWLLSPELFPIRREIANAASQNQVQWVDVFLTCISPEIARFPWETWQIGTDINAVGKIRIARTPNNIQYEPVRPLRRKPRILAIFGDDTGINLELDRQALQQQFRQIATIQVEGWKQGETDINALKTRICRAISDQQGWDILFFAGHSNEAGLTGGELQIAPQMAMFISELEPCLKQAKRNGLQFAIFNSCSGIDIAESLINLGLNQVVVMREPIHNKVAQDFLPQFLNCLAEYKDVHQAIREACIFFKQQEKRVNYPSAYLVPSIFRHPEAELFYLKKSRFSRLFPRLLCTNPVERVTLASVLFISLLYPLQDKFIDLRLFSQALYRQQTGQITPPQKTPVLLVQIDRESISNSQQEIQLACPLNYRYLGQLINQISQSNATVIGIDYILDRDQEQPENAAFLTKAIRDGVKQDKLFIFAARETVNPPEGISENLASLNWSMEADIQFFPGFIELLSSDESCDERCPFAYLLALTHQLNSLSDLNKLAKPRLDNKTSLRSELFSQLKNSHDKNQYINYLFQLKLPKTVSFLQLQWLHPLIDLSIPPNRVYETISAQNILSGNIPRNIENQVVIIAPGGYIEAGIDCLGGDNFALPRAISFWKGASQSWFTGGEYHAYIVHNLLTKRLVVPIPDFWMILCAAVVGKCTLIILEENTYRQNQLKLVLGGATLVYILVCLQIYISLSVLIPCFFPIVVFWSYLMGGRKS